MRRNAHWKSKDRKEDMAQDIRDWVHRTSDPQAKLETLTRLSSLDLTVLMLAIRQVDPEFTQAGAVDVTRKEPTERPFKHVHNWCSTDNPLVDRCSVCSEERP